MVCGHRIGKNSFIAAGSVVTADVPDHALMVGVPARQKGWCCACGEAAHARRCTVRAAGGGMRERRTAWRKKRTEGVESNEDGL